MVCQSQARQAAQRSRGMQMFWRHLVALAVMAGTTERTQPVFSAELG